ncbi:MAG: aldo/keto reductase [Anaerovoracaceae bacterium]
MNYTNFKGKKLSKLGFGTLRLPEKRKGELDFGQIQQMVDCAMEGGVNYFDTAYSYGNEQAEKALGQALSGYPRESYYLADKIPTWKCREKSDVGKIFDEQLRRCRTEYFDFYLIHSVKEHRYEDIEKFSVMEYLKEEKERGRIRHIGASAHCGPDLLRKMLASYEELEFIQLQINYMDWEYFQAGELYRIAEEFEKPVFVMEPLRGGMLADPVSREARRILDEAGTGASYASLAMRFVAELSAVAVVLSGVSDLSQLKENIRIFANPVLTQRERQCVRKAVSALQADILIPCTSCDYCSGCPAGIPISQIFKTYNEAAAWDFHRPWKSLSGQYRTFSKNGRDCIRCGKCQSHCPQNIPIIDRLAMIDKKYAQLAREGK